MGNPCRIHVNDVVISAIYRWHLASGAILDNVHRPIMVMQNDM